jgi:uncharacterized protein
VPVSPSFDCAKNPSRSEKIICANAILSKYDVVLYQNYKNIKERLEADNQKTLAAGNAHGSNSATLAKPCSIAPKP